MSQNHELPIRIPNYLSYIANLYQKKGDELRYNTISCAKVFVEEETNYDNWNGGTYGHTVYLYLPESVLVEIDLNDLRADLSKEFSESLNKCSQSIGNEFVDCVYFEVAEPASPHFNKSTPIQSERKYVAQDADHIWKESYIKLFISHRDSHKEEVKYLASELSKYGVSCFVAHDSIIPLSEWQTEIEKALFTMDALMVYLTDEFANSSWTDQEVGVSIGRGVPIIPVKAENKDPYGLISKYQAVKIKKNDYSASAASIFDSLASKISSRFLIEEAFIESFVKSTSFDDSIFAMTKLLPTIKSFSEKQTKLIQSAYKTNNQLHDCYVVNKGLPNLLYEKTGKRFSVQKSGLICTSDAATEIPF